MILEKDLHDVESIGFASTKVAEIKATPQMLRMLSSGIYSDKIAAFIRELSTNAYDAMVENGTIRDKTFYVHLPTKLEPWYSIRDYGNGLSSTGMETNFSNFGDGTKAESNAYNGAFGLGSKSPLSYVRDFTITSYHKGTKTFYNYGKNDEDVPMLSTAYSIPSDEPSGLEIQIAIQQNDIPEVLRKAELVYRYFDKKPDTNVTIEYHKLEKILSGDDWFLTTGDKTGSYVSTSTPTRVVMGNVAYPITGASGNIASLNYTPLVIIANIGDVQMTPSRESLEMTPKTIKFLEDKFKVIKSELSTNIEKTIDPALSGFDKVIKGIEALKALPSTIKTNVKIGEYEIPTSMWQSIFKIPKDIVDLVSFRILCKNPGYSDKKNLLVSEEWRPKETNDYSFLVVDDNKRVDSIIADLKDKYKYVYVLRFSKMPPAEKLATLDKFLKSCGNPKYIKASDYIATLPPLVKKPKGTTTSTTKRVIGLIKGTELRVGPQYHGLCSIASIVIHPDDKGPFYYVKTYNGELLDHKGNKLWGLTGILCNIIQKFTDSLGKKDITILSVTSQYYNKVEKDPRFECLFKTITDTKLKISWLTDKESMDFLSKISFNSNIKKYVSAEKSPDLVELLKLKDEYVYNNYKSSYEYLNCEIIPAQPVDVDKHKDKVEKYLYLNHLSHTAPAELVEFIIDLIEDNKLNLIPKDKK